MDKLLSYLKTQILLKKLKKEEVLAKFPQFKDML